MVRADESFQLPLQCLLSAATISIALFVLFSFRLQAFLFLRFPAMRRSAEDALLPSAGDQLPEDPRPSKSAPQPTKTRTITVHNLPVEGCADGVTSLQFEVPSDGIIDNVKRCISERLTNESFYLPRRLFHLQSGGVHQP